MKVVQRKAVRKEKKPQVPMWVPAWVKRELSIGPRDESDWFIGEDDNGERFAGLRRIPKEKEGEEEKGEEGEEEGK